MTQVKSKKKKIIVALIVALVLIVANFLLNGINLVPLSFRNIPVSFLTSDLTWDSKPSDFMIKYGLPENISNVNDITGERTFDYKFVYDEKDIYLSAENSWVFNDEFHRYYFTIDCKAPEEASKYFDECHNMIMDLYKDTSNFKFEGTKTDTDYEFTDSISSAYSSTNENGVTKTTIIDDNGNEIPIEEADNVKQVKTKTNEYAVYNAVGVFYSLMYSENDSCVILIAEILY